jgi:hypothetical protein
MEFQCCWQLKNGTYALIMQSDGNLCVYESYSGPGHGALIWQSQTAGGTSFAAMQDDGIFVFTGVTGRPIQGFDGVRYKTALKHLPLDHFNLSHLQSRPDLPAKSGIELGRVPLSRTCPPLVLQDRFRRYIAI